MITWIGGFAAGAAVTGFLCWIHMERAPDNLIEDYTNAIAAHGSNSTEVATIKNLWRSDEKVTAKLQDIDMLHRKFGGR